MRVWLHIQGSRVRSRSGPILSWRLIMKWFLRSFSSLPLIHSRRVVVSYKRKYVHELLVNRLFKPAQEKSVVRWTDRPAMTIAVDLGRKATKPTNQFGGPTVSVRIRCICETALIIMWSHTVTKWTFIQQLSSIPWMHSQLLCSYFRFIFAKLYLHIK